MNIEQQYLNLMQNILDTGERVSNRTGIDTLMVPGAHLTADLSLGFPALTTKRLAWKAVKGELLAFLEAKHSAADFRKYDCNIWDQNANENSVWLSNPHRQGTDDLGKIYGVQWRSFDSSTVKINNTTVLDIDGTDQIENALQTVLNNPQSRRILVNAWNPNQLDQMALPPCHILFQLLPNPQTRVMHMCMYQRSCDMFLGIPFNIASYALLLELFCRWTGYRPGKLNMFLADCHIYLNHIDAVRTQFERTPYPMPTLFLGDTIHSIDNVPNAGPTITKNMKLVDQFLHLIDLDDIHLNNYVCHSAIKAPMAV